MEGIETGFPEGFFPREINPFKHQQLFFSDFRGRA